MAKAPARSSCGDYSKFEVKKESNGKLRCLVCPSLPSLDTFEMFLVHKEGKKHQAALVDFRKKIQLAKKKKPLSHKPTRAHSKVTAKPTYLPYQSRVQNFVPPSCVPTVPQDVANQWKEYNVSSIRRRTDQTRDNRRL